MANQLTVINQALNELGRQAIDTVEDSEDAVLMQQRLEILFPELLLATDWNFAIKFVQDDTPLTSNFSADYNYTYQLPADYGRMDRVGNRYSNFQLDYRILDELILSNSRPVEYYYVTNEVPYDVLPAMFIRVLSLYLASQTCAVLTNDVQLTQYLNREYKEKLVGAILQNDMDRDVQQVWHNSFDRTAFI